VTASIVYDATTQGYTLTVNGRSQTFLPANIDPGQSNATITVYLKTSGSTTDSLTLTNAGTSGQLTYQYVGSAFWQRTINGSTSISGNIDALTYGALTAANAVPRAGQAHYQLGLLGAFSLSGGVTSVSGDGAMQVDFASGRLAADVRLANSGGSWQGTGTVASTGNGFSGNFASFMSSNQYTGQFAGHFFGPNAEEAGAAFHGRSPGDGSVFVGTIMGRKAAVGGNASFDTLSNPEFFSIGTNRIAFDRTGDNSAPANVSAGESALVIGYNPHPNPNENILNFFLPENVFRRRTSADQSGVVGGGSGGYAGLGPLLKTSSGWLQYNNTAPLKYMAAGRFVTVNGNRYVYDDFVFGFPTSRSALPAGMAGYQLNLAGTLLNSTESPRPLTGQGRLAIDFATGQLSAKGDVRNVDNFFEVYGTFNASGQLAASSSSFAGNFSVTGPANYNGAWNGGFFGPAGEEVGARFGASATNGNVMSGTLYGKRDDSVIAGTTPLADLTEKTALLGKASFVEEIDGSPPYVYGEAVRGIDITYDPASGDYIFKSIDPGLRGSIDTAFAGTELVPSDGNADFAAYRSADGQREARIMRFSGSGRQLQLSYSSFASVTLKRSDGRGGTLTNRYFVPFGSATSSAQMPRSGSASYSGLAFGKGYVSGIGPLANISGTIRSSVDFGTFNMETLVNLLATDPNGIATNRQLGEYLMKSFVSGNAFSGGRLHTDYSYMINGNFYGPDAAELGGIFTLSKDGPLGQIRGDFDISGGFVGKKD
jgi:hypothetical protein